jgi:cell wall-associated NlpC family hydrolase
MQFLSTTWRRWGTLAPGRPPGATPSAHNAWDAIHGAARKLCADAGPTGDVAAALYAYNPSGVYVDAVLAKAVEYGWGASSAPTGAVEAGGGQLVAGSGHAAVLAAAQALGVPYVWGGDTPESGFDCSGLVQWAYAQVGVHLPRTTRELIHVGVPVTLDQLQPGDLLFSRGGLTLHDLGHVVIYAGDGTVIAAPRRGTTVQFQILDAARVQAVRRVLPS